VGEVVLGAGGVEKGTEERGQRDKGKKAQRHKGSIHNILSEIYPELIFVFKVLT